MPPHVLPPQFCDPRPRRDAERMVYTMLSEQLSDGWTVIHDMAWIGSRRQARTSYIQADFLLCHPEHGVIVLEVKGGGISRQERVWYQHTREGKSVPMKLEPQKQAQEAAARVYDKLRDTTGKQFPSFMVVHAVCFPDCVVPESALDATIDRAIVIDQRDMLDLPAALARVRNYWQQRRELFCMARRLDDAWIETICETFARDIDLKSLLGPLLQIEQREIDRLSEEQANIFFATRYQRRLAVPGCAGSGKTLLAQILARRFAQAGCTVLLCCYNRPLRDELERLLHDVHDMVEVRNVDMLFGELARDLEVSYRDIGDATRNIVPALAKATVPRWPTYDVIITDEGQDIDGAWWPIIERCLATPTDSNLYIFYDDNQRIYHRKPALPSGMQEMPLSINFRSTRAIHAEILPFYQGHGSVLPLSVGPAGETPLFTAFDASNRRAQWEDLRALLQRLRAGEVEAKDIVILTPRAEHATDLVKLEPYLNLSHTPKPGAIQWETIYRFKGLERKIVIVVELDDAVADRDAINELLYVAYSRACQRLYVLYDGNLPEGHVRASMRGLRQASAETLASLNDEQRAAVIGPPGVAIVWAGAGSGKTRVLTQRVVYLIEAMGVAPEHVVALTFTKKAAREMRQRIRAQVARDLVDRLTIKTFHSFCYDILRDEIRRLPGRSFAGRTAEFEILDDEASKEFCSRVVSPPLQPEVLWDYISEQKTAGLEPWDAPLPEHDIDRLKIEGYAAYEDLLREHNRVDFDDLLLLTARLLEEYPEACSRRHRKHLALLIDEFQDTNPLQLAIVRAIYDPPEGFTDDGYPRSLFVVGDPQQSIYGFRGADYRLFETLRRTYPGLMEYQLVKNYRSTRQIVRAALTIAEPRYTGVPQLPLVAQRSENGPEVDILASEALEHEAYEIGLRIAETIRAGTPPKQIAVLLRNVRRQTHAVRTTNALEAVFRQLHIPYVLIGLQSFYRNPVINALIALLRALVAPDDDEHLRAVLTIFAKHVDSAIIDALIAARRERGRDSLWSLLTDTQHSFTINPYNDVISQSELDVPLVGPTRYAQIVEVARLILRLQRDLPTVADFHTFVGSIRTLAEFDRRFPEQRELEDYESLFTVFADHLNEGLNTGVSIAEVLSQAALLDEPPVEDDPQDGGRVQIMTIHKSKGLEFHTVFVPGMEEGVLPSARAETHADELEEGRICYVALTRARDQLTISYLPRRGRGDELEPSRYLLAIQHRLERSPSLPRRPNTPILKRPGGPIRLWPSRWSPYAAPVDVTVNLEHDKARYLDEPRVVVIDVTRKTLMPEDLAELEGLLCLISGAFPVDLLLDDPEDGIVQVSTGLRICGAPDLLELLSRISGLPVRLERMGYVVEPEA